MSRRFTARQVACGAAMLGLLAGAQPAAAQDSDNATVKLIQLLIAKGILSSDQAASLLSQAQNEARSARAAKVARKAAAAPVAAEPPLPPEVPKGTVRVTYVPPIVRDQIAAQVRQQILGDAQATEALQGGPQPGWTKRILVYGDVRVRGERVLESPANKHNATAPSGDTFPYPFTDYNAINNGSPFDVNGTTLPPSLNSTENRTRFRIRARLGVKAEVDDWISTDFRLATGNDTSPVSENQTLGQTGDFGKYAIWLDRAAVLLHVPDDAKSDPRSSLQLHAGRFGNPFWTTDLEYSDDVNFDGAALQAVLPVTRSLDAWATGGAFAVYNTAFNYGNSPSLLGESPSRDKYLFAAQAGVDWQAAPAINAKFAVGLFDYSNVEGRLSSPCTIFVTGDVCSSDNSRPQFLQFGNTLFPIRNISAASLTEGGSGGNANDLVDPQYYGLASRFDVLDLHGRLRLTRYDPVDVELEGEYSKNLGFDRKAVEARGPVNNFGSVPSGAAQAPYGGGDTAYMMKIEVGKPEIVRLGQWNVYFGYKHLDTDSVLDALTDSNFHGGGTNAKGFFVGGGYGVGRNSYVAARWYSANQVVGPANRNDILQVDLNSKF